MRISPPALEKLGFGQIRSETMRETYSPAGHEWISSLAPLPGGLMLQERRRQTAQLQGLSHRGSRLPFTRLDEIREGLENLSAEGMILPLPTLVAVKEHAALARTMRQFILKNNELLPDLQSGARSIVVLEELESRLKKSLTDQGEIRDDATKDLKRIRESLLSKRNELRQAAERVLRKLRTNSMAPDEGPTLRAGRLVIPIWVEHKRQFDGLLHDLSATGRTAYIEPSEVMQLNNDVRQIEIQETREVERILRELTSHVRLHRIELLSNEEVIGWLDGLQAIVRLGERWQGTTPQTAYRDEMKLRGARNPNLLMRTADRDAEPIVPLDLDLDPDERALIITGPNAGGKSVAMKSVGLLCILHQCGYPLPLHPDSVLPALEGCFVDIGDEQSIENDLSTFSSRLLWMTNTLRDLVPNSLVLIDEAGTGTDPEEGGALFQSFIEEVVAKGSRVITTTHHGSLKVFAHTTPGIVNGAMEFDQETLTPTYQFRKGIPGSSYAFEIAARMNLPLHLLTRARQILGTHTDKMGTLLLDLEKRLGEADQARAEYDVLKEEAARIEAEYRSKSGRIDQERRETLERAYVEAERILNSANRRIEQAVETIVQESRVDRTRIDKEKIRNVRESLKEQKEHIKQRRETLEKKKPSKPVPAEFVPTVGDWVRIQGSRTEGELVDLSGKNAIVLANGLRIKTQLEGLRRIDTFKKSGGRSTPGTAGGSAVGLGASPSSGKKGSRGDERDSKTEKKGTNKHRSKTSDTSGDSSPGGGGGDVGRGVGKIDADLNVRSQIDIRGLRVDEAEKQVTNYLDRAYARGLNKVELIHGTGGGVLRKKVDEILRGRDDVASHEMAEWDDGGPGKTIVRFN